MLCTIYFTDTHKIYILMNKPIYVHYAEKDCSYLLFTIMHLVYYCKFTQFVKKNYCINYQFSRNLKLYFIYFIILDFSCVFSVQTC